jgi:CHRD domain-containing protein
MLQWVMNDIRTRVCVALLSSLVVACGGGASPSPLPPPTGPLVRTREPTPTPPPTVAIVFTSELRSANEVPPITDAEASCTGQGRVILRGQLDSAGKIATATAQFSLLVTDCPNSTKITQAHIHQGSTGQAGPIKVDSGLKASAPIEMERGEMGINQPDIAVTDVAVIANMLANPAGYYLNVHSVTHPDGFLRGQLVLGG